VEINTVKVGAFTLVAEGHIRKRGR
jgi:hypothetical protein